MSWLMYATRSTMRTILPSCVSGSLLARVLEDPVAHLPGQVQLLGDPQRLLVVAEAGAEPLAEARVERLLARVAERRVPHVVPEPDRLGQILVQPQAAGDTARDPGRLQRVGHARPEMVSGRVDEDLRLALQPAERLRVQDPVAIALERRAQAAFVLLAHAPARLVRAHGERREPGVLLLPDPRLECVGYEALGHPEKATPRRGRPARAENAV